MDWFLNNKNSHRIFFTLRRNFSNTLVIIFFFRTFKIIIRKITINKLFFRYLFNIINKINSVLRMSFCLLYLHLTLYQIYFWISHNRIFVWTFIKHSTYEVSWFHLKVLFALKFWLLGPNLILTSTACLKKTWYFKKYSMAVLIIQKSIHILWILYE